jgi:hypothetical protein
MPTKFSLQFLDTPSSLYEFWKFELFSRNFSKSKRKEKMKKRNGLGFRPKTTVSGHDVGWWPTVAVGCHGGVAHRVAWPGRHGGPWCTRAARAWVRHGTVTVREASVGGHGLLMVPIAAGSKATA